MKMMCNAGVFRGKFLMMLLVTGLWVCSPGYGQVTIVGLSINGKPLSMGNATLCSNMIIDYELKVDTSAFPPKYNFVDFYAIFSNRNGSFGASDSYKIQLWGIDNNGFKSNLNGGILTISGSSLVYDTLLNFPGDQYRIKFKVVTIDDDAEFISADNGFDISMYQIPPIPQVSNQVLEEGQTIALTTTRPFPSGNILHWYTSVPEGTVTSFSNGGALTITGVSFPRTFYLIQESNKGCVSEFKSFRVFPTSDYYCEEYMYQVAALSETINSYRKILFLDELTGFVTGNGSVYKTENEGNTWRGINIGSNFLIRDMQFISSTVGFVVGSGGKIAKSTNGGESWNLLGAPDSNNRGLNSIKFINEQEGLVGNLQGDIYLTTNGGIAWAKVYSSLPEFNSVIFDILFQDNQIVYAVVDGNYYYSGGKNLILKTTNRGRTWNVVSTLTGGFSLTSLCYVGNNVIYVSGGGSNSLVTNGIVYKSIDGGISWDLVLDTKSDFNFMYDMIMLDEWKGYAATAQGNVLKTKDGWQSYYQINRMNQGYLDKYYIPGAEGLPSLTKLNDTTLLANSFDGKIYKTILPSLGKPTISGNFSELKSSADYGNQWYLNDQSIPGANGKSFIPTASGSYSVRQRNGCKESQISNAITVTEVWSKSGAETSYLYPNPAVSMVSLPQNIGLVNIYSNLGVKLQSFPEGTKDIDLQSFETGLYIVETTNPSRRMNLMVVK